MDTRNVCGSLTCCDPKRGPRKLGNTESGIRKSICLRPKRGPRKLGNSESGIWGSIGLGPKMGPRRLGNSESGIWVYLQTADPRGGLGNSETRNLEFAEQYPGICTPGILESGSCGGVSWNLHTWNLGIWKVWSFRGPTEGPWKLGNSETGTCGTVSRNLRTWNLGNWMLGSLCGPTEGTRKLGNSETRNLEFGFPCCKVAPPPPRALGDRSSLPGPSSPPGSTAFRKWTSQDSTTWIPQYGHLETRNLEKFCVRVQDAIGTEIRSTENDHLRHYALAHHRFRRLAKNAKIHSTPSRDDSVSSDRSLK